MILNLTRTPYSSFTAVQVLATEGLPVMDHPFVSLDDVYNLFDKSGPFTTILVPWDLDDVIVNDIINATPATVATLFVVILPDFDHVSFIEYESLIEPTQ